MSSEQQKIVEKRFAIDIEFQSGEKDLSIFGRNANETWVNYTVKNMKEQALKRGTEIKSIRVIRGTFTED